MSLHFLTCHCLLACVQLACLVAFSTSRGSVFSKSPSSQHRHPNHAHENRRTKPSNSHENAKSPSPATSLSNTCSANVARLHSAELKKVNENERERSDDLTNGAYLCSNAEFALKSKLEMNKMNKMNKRRENEGLNERLETTLTWGWRSRSSAGTRGREIEVDELLGALEGLSI